MVSIYDPLGTEGAARILSRLADGCDGGVSVKSHHLVTMDSLVNNSGFYHLVLKIFSVLDCKSLVMCCLVNQTWGRFVFRNFPSVHWREGLIRLLKNEYEFMVMIGKKAINIPNYPVIFYENGDFEITEYFLEIELFRDIVQSRTSDNGLNMLQMACRDDQENIVKSLLKMKCLENVHSIPIRFYQSGHFEILQYFLEKNLFHHIVRSRTDDNGMTLLHMACRDGKEEIVKLLLKMDCCVNSVDHHGQTPMHLACENSRFGPLRLLLLPEINIDWSLNHLDKKNKKPLQYLRNSDLLDTEILQLPKCRKL